MLERNIKPPQKQISLATAQRRKIMIVQITKPRYVYDGRCDNTTLMQLRMSQIKQKDVHIRFVRSRGIRYYIRILSITKKLVVGVHWLSWNNLQLSSYLWSTQISAAEISKISLAYFSSAHYAFIQQFWLKLNPNPKLTYTINQGNRKGGGKFQKSP